MQNEQNIKRGNSTVDIAEVILERWSPRSFSDKPVADADLAKLFTAASWAASSFNEQPWRFLLGRRGDDTYAKITSTLSEHNQEWARLAPVLFLSSANAAFALNGKPNDYALHDLGAACATLALEAASIGLYVHGMAGFDHEQARSKFHIPPEVLIGAVWAIGHLGDPDLLSPGQRATEVTPRTRKPLRDILFASWNTPATV